MRNSRFVSITICAAAMIAAGCSDATAPAASRQQPVRQGPGILASLASTTSNDGALTVNVNAPDSIDRHGSGAVTIQMASGVAGDSSHAHSGLDIVAVMDASGSIGTSGWVADMNFVSDVVQTYANSSTRFGIVEFSTQTYIRYTFLQDQTPSVVSNVVQNLPYLRGETYTRNAMDAAYAMFTTSDSTRARLALLITDGLPNPSTQSPCNLAPALQAAHIRVVIIGVGPDVTESALSCLLTSPADFIPVASYTSSALNDVLQQLNPYIHPALTNLTVTATVAPAFTVTALPTPTEAVNSTTSAPGYNPGTHTLTWSLSSLGAVDRGISFTLAPSGTATPVCGVKDALTNVQASYTDPLGAAHSIALANTQIKISGCEPPKVTPTITGTMGNDGWYTSNVQVSWDVQSDAALTSETGCDAVTLGTDTDGITYTCTASSDEGTTTKSVTVKRDATPPALAFSGNAGTYGVSQVVNISCSASDATSGLASSTCPEVSDSAYTLALGGHTLSATATDHAGNA
ncbi:MAG TPA: vWA domain-containing protein, partial [Gemmatimonadaceae bacterium]|nr:vWA domain-containing protein [Gemmatimonadaceae bacterium]